MRRTHAPSPEPRTKDGLPLLTENQMLLLEALWQQPTGGVDSYNAWVASVGILESNARRSVRNVPSVWVERQRVGSRIVVMLTPRARDILEGRVPARVRGVGPYRPKVPPTPVLRVWPPSLF